MKRCYLLGLLIALFVGSCSDSENKPTPPAETGKITVASGTVQNPVLTTEGGAYKVTFEATADWTASFSNPRAVDWISVEPTTGKAGTNTVTVKATSNETYDERNATLEIQCGTDRFTMSFAQKQKDALLLTSEKQEVKAEGGTFAVEIKANVEYTLTSDVDWIRQSTLKALDTKTQEFAVQPNEALESRTGHILINAGALSATVTVYQAGQEAFIALDQKEHVVTAAASQLKIDLKSSVDFEYQVTKGADWISESQLRSISTHTLYFDIEANESYESRKGEIVFKDTQDKGITDTVKIYQTYKGALILAKDRYDLPAQATDIQLEVQHNVDYAIHIDVDWIHQTKLKALQTDQLCFAVDANDSNEREGKITFVSQDLSLKQTITVYQEGKPDPEAKERALLIQLYEALDGENWTRQTNWCTNEPLNQWYGVDYNLLTGQVYGLSLGANNLTGTIPDCLFELTGLENLFLGENHLTGTLSPRFAELTQLKKLHLYMNDLEGNIPEEWASLTGVESFMLSNNRFSGVFPTVILNMSNYDTAMKGHYEKQQDGYGFTFPVTTEMIDLGNNLYLHPEGWALEYRVPTLALPDDAFFQTVDNQIYSHFKDEFDFIYYICNTVDMGISVAGFNSPVQLDVDGLGRARFDNTANYGSSGKLKANIVITNYRGMYAEGPFLHETFHYWGAMDIGQEHGSPTGSYTDNSHWGISSVDGSIGGFRLDLLQRNVDGDPTKYKAGCSAVEQYGEQNPLRFTQAGVSNQYYPPLELYMMGLIPTTEVEPIHIFKGVKAPANTWSEGTFYAESEETVTIDDIVAKHGARQPASSQAQKQFRGLAVIVTESPVADNQWKDIIEDIQNQEKQGQPTQSRPNFYMATGQRATMSLSNLATYRK